MNKEIIKLLKREIAWCKKHPAPTYKSKEWRDGFIDGIGQAIKLIKLLPKSEK